jgi:phosphohistidine phosphatase
VELYIMRHGIAEDGKPGMSDSSRQLTPDGRERTAAVLKLARKTGVKPDLILSSPYIRAAQTARLAREELGVQAAVIDFPALVPHGSPEIVWKELRDYSAYASLLITGHEPLLGIFTAYALGTPELRIAFKKAAIIRVDLESLSPLPKGVLRWMMVPAMV